VKWKITDLVMLVRFLIEDPMLIMLE